MSTRDFNGAYLLSLFGEVERARTDGAYRQLPAPAPASSLAIDDAPLGAYSAAHLIRASYTAGLAHADALRRLTAAGEVDLTSPWTLLRGGDTVRRPLGHGDLIVMGGSCQRGWEHSVPKAARAAGPRISVQFRPHGVH